MGEASPTRMSGAPLDREPFRPGRPEPGNSTRGALVRGPRDREAVSPGPAAPLAMDREAVVRYVGRATRVLHRHRSLLDRLDAALGDGDHGENMALGFHAVLRSLDEGAPRDLGGVLRSVGHVLVESVGGASGPLYGTAFIEAGFALRDVERLDGPRIADALDAGVRGLSRRGRCSLGDKTILDALQPAARTFREVVEAGRPLDDALRSAAWAAHAGMRATIPLVARRGLALRLGERSRGHQDPGATSCFLLIRAMVAVSDPRAPGDVPGERPA